MNPWRTLSVLPSLFVLLQSQLCIGQAIEFDRKGLSKDLRAEQKSSSWSSEKISPVDAWRKIGSGAVVIDVRTRDEFQKGHIEGALNIPYETIEAQIEELKIDKSKDILLYDKTGRRAALVEGILRDRGYERVFNAGGYFVLRDAKPK